MSNFFGTVKSTSTPIFEVPVYEGYVAPTADAVMAIATESVIEGLHLQAALHVADATVTFTAVHESAQKAELVLESVIGSTFNKIKDGLKSLWAKIKAWFAQVGKTFSLLTNKGKDFIKKYKKEIESKPSAGFNYEGFVWDIDAGNAKAKAILDEIEGTLDEKLKAASGLGTKFATMTADQLKGQDVSNIAKEFDLADIKETLTKELGNKVGAGDDISEIKEKLQEIYRGGDEKVEIKDFGKMNRSTLIDLVENADKKAKVITVHETAINKQFTATLTLIGKLEAALSKSKDTDYHASGDGDDANSKKANARGRLTSLASMVSNVTRYAQSLNTAIAGSAVDNVKAAAGEAESVLKQFLRFKATKESFVGDENGENDSVLESIIGKLYI